jgi:hypothetical protein
LEDVVVVVDAVALAAASCSGLFADAELACHSIIIPFTTCTLATTIDTIITDHAVPANVHQEKMQIGSA